MARPMVHQRTLARWAALAVLAGTLVLVLPQQAWAATLLVPQTFPTIQEAVDAAGEGDVIRVRPRGASYEECVVVTTDDLTITKQSMPGRPVIDVFGCSPGVDIDADKFKMEQIIVRHGGETAIDCTGNRCRFAEIKVDGRGQFDCLRITGNEARVRDSFFTSCGSSGSAIELSGNQAEILRNRAVRMGGVCYDVNGNENTVRRNLGRVCENTHAFEIDGDRNLIHSNTGRTSDDDGINVDGDMNEIVENVARNTEDDGIDAGGNDNKIRDNVVVGVDGECYELDGERIRFTGNLGQFCISGGADVDGRNPVVRDNAMVDCGEDDCFWVRCDTACGGDGRVTNNLAEGSNNDDEGFDIRVDPGTGTFPIRNNVAKLNIEEGFLIVMDDGIVSGNRAVGNGAEREEGFEIFGDRNVIEDNVARSNGANGFEIGGSENLVRRNLAVRNNIDGFRLRVNDPVDSDPSTDNVFRRNRAIDNRADGIENDGATTDFILNESRDNRRPFDCVNDGSLGVVSGNQCRRGGEFTSPSSGIES